MTSRATHVVVVLVVVAACYGAFLTALFRHVTARTPAGIVRRLCRTARPVTLTVNVVNARAWDPSKPLGQGGFYAHGTATYTLDDPQTIRVRFLPRGFPRHCYPTPPACAAAADWPASSSRFTCS